MSYQLIEKDQLNIHLFKTSKFKTIEITLKFLIKAKKENITMISLLPYVLKSSSLLCKSKRELNTYLENMYGALFSVNASKQGIASVITFNMKIVNPKYLKNVSLIEDALALLQSIVYNPVIENNGFQKTIVDEEIRLLNDEFDSIKENKTKYAMNRLIEIMCKDELYSIHSLGDQKDLEKINENNLYDFYLEFLNNSSLDIIVNGDITDDVIDKFPKYFKPNNNKRIDWIDYEDKEIKEITKVVECDDIQQAKLDMGFRTHVRIGEELAYALIVLNGILGGYPHSKLFINVREKNSLCYYVASRSDSLKGVLMVYAGIDSSNFDKTVSLVLEEIDKIKKGEITDNDLDLTKVNLINDFREAFDSQTSITHKIFNDLVFKRGIDFERALKEIQNVKKDDVIKCANLLELDTIYLLKEEEK